MHRLIFVPLCCLLSGCFALGAADRADDAANFQGTWKIVSVNGESIGDAQWVVEGDRYTVKMGWQSLETWKITLDAKSKHLDAFHHDTPPGTFGGKLKGLYEIKGDSLKVCYDATGQHYPKSFDMGSGKALYQLQRAGK